MKNARTQVIRIVFVVALLIVGVVSGGAARDWHRRTHPGAAFASINGRELPPGVQATAYAHATTDNLFHTTHYWLLAGSATALREVIVGSGLRPSDDARYVLPNLQELFGASQQRTEVVAGYESDSPRNEWYFIFAGEESALYAH